MNKAVRLYNITIVILAQLILFEPLLWASESHSAPELGVYWVNFLIYITALYLILRKPLSKTWSSRREALIKEVSRLAVELNSIEGDLRKTQFKMRSLAEEKERLKKNIFEQAESEANEIIKSAERRAGAIITNAKSIIEIEKRAMVSRQKNRLAETIALSVEKIIADKLTPAAEKNILKKALNNLEALN
ncbi:MAG TPA: ATP synthase F0 subunit B [Oligoflexia bacterium]|nr:ATP synthase F0 subunit B [Oligoflexia bacterium]HMP26838.1 ATP synthase F0 subunit B [Oligoflexia bacterium]